MTFRATVIMMVSVATVSGLAACGSVRSRSVSASAGPGIQQTVPAAAPVVSRPIGARVVVLAPQAGQTVGRDFAIRVRLIDFRLGHPSARRSGGELEFVLDGGRFDEPGFSRNGRLALDQAVNGFYSPAFAPVMAYRRIPFGTHRLVVRLADGVGRVTGVSTTVTFRVR